MNTKTLFLLLLLLATSARADEPALRLKQTIPLPGVKGRFDHFAIDRAGARLFVAALGNNSVEVFDTAAGKLLPHLTGMDEPQGIAFLAEAKTLAVASGGDGKCRFFDQSLKQIGTVDDLDDADNVRYDATAHRVYVGYGKGALGVIEASKLAGSIKLDGHPESFQLETNGNRIFVNVPSAKHVALIDREKRQVIARWPLKDDEANFPMALDEASKRLFIVCRKPAKLLVIDADSGKLIASEPTCGDADDVWIDAKNDRVYVSGGEGFVSVHQHAHRVHWPQTRKIPTRAGARTSFFDPDAGKLYVAARASEKEDTAILVFDVIP